MTNTATLAAGTKVYANYIQAMQALANKKNAQEWEIEQTDNKWWILIRK